MTPNSAEAISFREAEAGPRFATAPAGPPRQAFPADELPDADGGTPVTFGRTTGFLHPGSSAVGVLMLSPIGYEELCGRAAWRRLASAIAATGVPCLRFDYPGTGDALDPSGDDCGLEDWREAAHQAADRLRATGVESILLLGQGLGGALALDWAAGLGPLAGCILLAPVASGRRYLRELGAWSRLVNDGIGIPRDPDDEAGCAVGGFLMPRGRAAAIRGLDATAARAPAPEVLLVARPDHVGDATLADTLSNAGSAVTRLSFEGYDALMTDPTAAAVPVRTIAAVAEWAARQAAAHRGRPRAVRRAPLPPCLPLRDGELVERPLRFGPGGRLFGILADNAARPARRVVVFVNAGREHRVGWGRVTVDQARALAARGIASLRFDCGGAGDSPAAADAPEEFLYSSSQVDDVRTAIDLVEAEGFREIVVAGRCSGAFAAVNAAVADERVACVVAVNLPRVVWDPDESVAESLRYGHRSFSDFGATFWKRDGFRRLLAGRLRVGAGLRHVRKRLVKAASWRLAPILGRLSKQGRLHRETHRRVAAITGRGARLALIFSDHDPGLGELHRRFGAGARQLERYRGASLALVPDADHNFTHRGARERLLAALLGVLAP